MEDKELIQNEEKKEVSQKTILDAQLDQIEQMNELAKDVKESSDSDREKADNLYDFMQDQIDIDNDKNPATRDAMAKALELKMKATDQKIELLKIKAKLINPNKGNAININLGNYDTQKGGDTNELIDIVEQLKNE